MQIVSLRCGLSIRRHRPDGLFWRWQRETSHVLRDAHAYMLISIPTATSTIFGAFQAMFSSFQVGRRHLCFSTIARFGWWTHLSTRIRRRNCDQGSRPDRRLRRAAEPTSFRSNPSQGNTHLQADSANDLWSNRTPATAHKVRLRSATLPSAYTCATTLVALCSRWAKQRRIDISA